MGNVKRNVSIKAHNILNAQEIRAKFPYLIEVTYNLDGEHIERYVNSDEPVEYEGKVYNPAIFQVTPPEITETKIGNATLQMSNIDQEWIRRIRLTKDRAKVSFISVMQWDEDGTRHIESLFNNDFILTDVSWDEISITWTMVFDDKWDVKIPSHICDCVNCAGVA